MQQHCKRLVNYNSEFYFPNITVTLKVSKGHQKLVQAGKY